METPYIAKPASTRIQGLRFQKKARFLLAFQPLVVEHFLLIHESLIRFKSLEAGLWCAPLGLLSLVKERRNRQNKWLYVTGGSGWFRLPWKDYPSIRIGSEASLWRLWCSRLQWRWLMSSCNKLTLTSRAIKSLGKILVIFHASFLKISTSKVLGKLSSVFRYLRLWMIWAATGWNEKHLARCLGHRSQVRQGSQCKALRAVV